MENNDRAYAHYKRAKMYTKYGDVKKANAHMGRAMHYYRRGSARFGSGWELDMDGPWTLVYAASTSRTEDSLTFTFVRGKKKGKEERKTMTVRGLSVNFTGTMQYVIKSPLGTVYSPGEAKAYLPSFLEAILTDTDKAWKLIDAFQSSYTHVKYSESDVVRKLLKWRELEHDGADYEIHD